MINTARMRRPLTKAALASILLAGALLAVAVTVQARDAGAWLRRRENFPLGDSLRRGQSRTTSGTRAGAGGPQAGRDRDGYRFFDCGDQTRDSDDPDCDGKQQRSGRDRVRGEPRAPRRQCHRTQQYVSRSRWEAAGAADGSRPWALPRGVSLESRRP